MLSSLEMKMIIASKSQEISTSQLAREMRHASKRNKCYDHPHLAATMAVWLVIVHNILSEEKT